MTMSYPAAPSVAFSPENRLALNHVEMSSLISRAMRNDRPVFIAVADREIE